MVTQLSWHRIIAGLLVAGCLALAAVAIFNVRPSVWRDSPLSDIDDVSLSSLFWSNSQASRPATAVQNYSCPQCGSGMGWGSNACPLCRWRQPRRPKLAAGLDTLVAAPSLATTAVGTVPYAPGMAPIATPIAQAVAGARPPGSLALLPSPREQNAAGKEFIEGHWLGIEVIPLVPELATVYQIPKGESGVLVDEITLEGAESGILAGDMIYSIDGCPTTDLRAFFLATQHVQQAERAEVSVSRRGSRMTFTLDARNTKILGFAQMEAAQPIKPGALRPHRARGRACTDCHIIMQSGGQLPTDAGDILPSPPAISKNATARHRYRGDCSTCHVIIR